MIEAMSAREDSRDTIPPPDGEEDAYTATTKVGAMPAEVMARLRAEGLLPEEGTGKARPASRAPTPVPSVMADVGIDEVTTVYAELSPHEVIPSLSSSAPPPPPRVTARPAPSVPARAAPTPVARAELAPPKARAMAHEPPSLPSNDEAESAEIRAFGGRSRTRMLAVLIAGIVALVVLAFVMALLSQRR
jgi:hypothetical protein